MSISLLRTSLLLAGMAAGAALHAAPPTLGLTAGAAWPAGATRDTFTNNPGFTLGAFADWEQRPGQAVRLALDGSFYSRGSVSGPEGIIGSGRVQSRALTLNYVFTPHADLQGLYFVVGMGGGSIQRVDGDILTESGLKLAWNAGFGVDINDRWGILARYQSITNQGRSLGQVTAGLTYRF